MNTNVTKSAETTKNYSEEQEQILRDNVPYDLAQARVVGLLIGKSHQSVIAKVQNMGLPYTRKEAPRKKAVQDTKEQIANSIQSMIDRDCEGLSKATRKALLNVQNGVQHILASAKTVEPATE